MTLALDGVTPELTRAASLLDHLFYALQRSEEIDSVEQAFNRGHLSQAWTWLDAQP